MKIEAVEASLKITNNSATEPLSIYNTETCFRGQGVGREGAFAGALRPVHLSSRFPCK